MEGSHAWLFHWDNVSNIRSCVTGIQLEKRREADGRKTLQFPKQGIQEGIGINLCGGFKGKVEANYPNTFLQHKKRDSSV